MPPPHGAAAAAWRRRRCCCLQLPLLAARKSLSTPDHAMFVGRHDIAAQAVRELNGGLPIAPQLRQGLRRRWVLVPRHRDALRRLAAAAAALSSPSSSSSSSPHL